MATHSELLFLAQLRRESTSAAGWSTFVERYSGLVLQVVRKFASEHDDVLDRYLYACEQLAADGCRRLKSFKRGGEAEFAAWLRAVVRNLCIDYLRQQIGRRRLPRSISRMSDLDQRLFELVFWAGHSAAEAFEELRTSHRGLTLAEVLDSHERLQLAIRPLQHALMVAPRPDSRAAAVEAAVARLTDRQPGADTLLAEREQLDALAATLAELPDEDRLLLRLRFDQGLTLAQIARVVRLGDYRKVHQRLGRILEAVRNGLGRRGFS